MTIALKPIERQVAVVFGASSGIGRATALAFARRGARVVVSARGETGLRSLVDEIQSAGGSALSVPADATDFEQVRGVAERAVAAYGGIDTWVQLAAVTVYATFEQTTPEEFRRVVEVNLIGQANGAWAALPHLRRSGGGALIMVSSIEARRALPYHSAYAASKHGVGGLSEALRLELRHEGAPVSVTNIMPPSINTPFFDKARTKLGVKPMGLPPVYPPELVADAILHAAEHPVREIVVSGVGKLMDMSERLSPQLMDAFMLRFGFEGQKTAEPKALGAPDNLYEPLGGYDQVKGTIGEGSQLGQLVGKMNLSPSTQRVLGIALLGGAALLLDRMRTR
jgi:NAD(P)-dependent dehydrogenase (short-subunit alcohol dehydrogenase family)